MDKKNMPLLLPLIIALVGVIVLLMLKVNKETQLPNKEQEVNSEIDKENKGENEEKKENSEKTDYERLGITDKMFETVYRYWAPMLAYYGYDKEQLPELVLDEILLNKIMYDEATKMGYALLKEEKDMIDKQFELQSIMDELMSAGIDMETLKTFLYNNAVISRYLDEQTDKVTEQKIKDNIIKNEGISADFNLYKTSHILFAFTTSMTKNEKETLLNKANKVLEKAKKGEKFSELAKEYSEDYATATNGGNFDMLNNQTVVKEYREAVITLKAGQIYPYIVETEYGYHIIKLNSIEKDGRLKLEEEKDSYINSYISHRIELEYDKNDEKNKLKLTELKQKAYIINTALGIV